jgi:cob(I)alamin adenosyltransferase
MRIYTRTGDDGSTGLFGGVRVSKAAARVEAYGTLDEANAFIGRARASISTSGPEQRLAEIDLVLAQVQAELFVVGAELACAPGQEDKLSAHMSLVDAAAAERLERAIDEAEVGLPALTSFVLPGGSPAGADLHVARCVVRRAERLLVAISEPKGANDAEAVRREVVVYLNRLSDLLFTLARRANHLLGVADVPWKVRE